TLTFPPSSTPPIDGRFFIEGTYRSLAAPEPTAHAITLRFANILDDIPDEIVAYALEVEELSNGEIGFEFESEYGADSWEDAERVVIGDVSDGTIDMGWVGTRALPDLDPLMAPMLIDSYDLEQRVFEAGIPEEMMQQLDEPGVVGLTVLPGPLRKIFST